MAIVIFMMFYLQSLAGSCNSNIRETINNVQSNNALEEDLTMLLETHTMNTLIVLIVITAMLIIIMTCYGCVCHTMSVCRQSLRVETEAYPKRRSCV